MGIGTHTSCVPVYPPSTRTRGSTARCLYWVWWYHTLTPWPLTRVWLRMGTDVRYWRRNSFRTQDSTSVASISVMQAVCAENRWRDRRPVWGGDFWGPQNIVLDGVRILLQQGEGCVMWPITKLLRSLATCSDNWLHLCLIQSDIILNVDVKELWAQASASMPASQIQN